MRNLLATLLVTTTATAQGPLWVQNPTNGHYYALIAGLHWDQAELAAQAQGGHLATIRNAAEHDWLVQRFTAGMPEDTRVWIGLSDAAVEGTWVWTSGEPLAYTNWGLWEPDDVDGNQDHGALWSIPASHGGGWGWCDSIDTHDYQAIIEVAQLVAASYTTFGVGCPGPNSLTPSLAPLPGELPRPGTTSHLRVDGLPPVVTLPVLVIGSSSTWDPDGYPLPIDLAVLGWPGCSQLVSDETLLWAITTTGHADLPIVVPPGFPMGSTFHAQTLVLYAPTGVAVSNAVTGVVGY